MAALLDPADAAALARLRVAKLKAKHGVIERVGQDGRTAICRGMFKRETDLTAFRGMKVQPMCQADRLTCTLLPSSLSACVLHCFQLAEHA